MYVCACDLIYRAHFLYAQTWSLTFSHTHLHNRLYWITRYKESEALFPVEVPAMDRGRLACVGDIDVEDNPGESRLLLSLPGLNTDVSPSATLQLKSI